MGPDYNYNTTTMQISHVLSCSTAVPTMSYSLQSSSVHGIIQARILEWVAMPSFRGSSWPRSWTCISCVSCTAGRFFTHWATWEAINVCVCVCVCISSLLSLPPTPHPTPLSHHRVLGSFNGLEPGGLESTIRKWKRKKLIFLELCREPIKP